MSTMRGVKVIKLKRRLSAFATLGALLFLLGSVPAEAETLDEAIEAGLTSIIHGNAETLPDFFLARAERNDAMALFVLGQMYEFGSAVPRDFGKAARFYRLSADRDLMLAYGAMEALYRKRVYLALNPSDR